MTLGDSDIRPFITECCAGSEIAWKRFFELFHPLIAGTVRKTVEYDHEDIIQIIYCKFIDNNYGLLRKFRGESFFELLAYIRQVAFNTAVNQRRSQGVEKIRMKNIEDFLEHLRSDDNPETYYLQTEISHEVLRAIDQLSIKYREPVYLLMQGYKHKEIASILEIPIDTASTRIRRAYSQLQEKLQKVMIN